MALYPVEGIRLKIKSYRRAICLFPTFSSHESTRSSYAMFLLSLLATGLYFADRCHVRASSVALYNDTACTNVIENLAASNGYPDGQCTHFTDLEGGDTYKGLKFTTLDDGCASMSFESLPSVKRVDKFALPLQ